MAMRLYTKRELEAELRDKWKLKQTQHKTATTRAWITPKGNHVLVPIFADDKQYPDHILNKIVEQLEAFGEDPFNS